MTGENALVEMIDQNNLLHHILSSNRDNADILDDIIKIVGNDATINFNQQEQIFGRTPPLALASKKGHAKSVKLLLLQKGANPNISDFEGQTPLYIACQNGHTDIVKAFFDAGADLNKPISTGVTPLFIACHDGRTDVVKALIDAKADLNKPISTGATPLYIACQNGHTDIVKALIDAGADISILQPRLFYEFFSPSARNLKFNITTTTPPQIKNLIQEITTPKAIAIRDQNLRQNNYDKENIKLLKSYFSSSDPSIQVALDGNASEITPEIQSLTQKNTNQEVAKALLFLKFVAEEFSKGKSALTKDERISRMKEIYLNKNNNSSFIFKMIETVIENKNGLQDWLKEKTANELIESSAQESSEATIEGIINQKITAIDHEAVPKPYTVSTFSCFRLKKEEVAQVKK